MDKACWIYIFFQGVHGGDGVGVKEEKQTSLWAAYGSLRVFPRK